MIISINYLFKKAISVKLFYSFRLLFISELLSLVFLVLFPNSSHQFQKDQKFYILSNLPLISSGSQFQHIRYNYDFYKDISSRHLKKKCWNIELDTALPYVPNLKPPQNKLYFFLMLYRYIGYGIH
jgi:hypothetical protein